MAQPARAHQLSGKRCGDVTGYSTDNLRTRPVDWHSRQRRQSRHCWRDLHLLNNLVLPGGVVHKAGRRLTLTVTAYNGAGTPVVTSN